MSDQLKLPDTIAIRSRRSIKSVAEVFDASVDRTFTKAAEALIEDGKKFRALRHSRRPRRKVPA